MIQRLDPTNKTRRLQRAGQAVRLFPGVFAETETWRQATPWDRFDFACRAAGETRVLTGRAAAQVLGLPTWPVPDEVDVAVRSRGHASRRSFANAEGRLRGHVTSSKPVRIGALMMTPVPESIARAVAMGDLRSALILLDALARRLREQAEDLSDLLAPEPAGPRLHLPSLDEVWAVTEEISLHKGLPVLRSALSLASAEGESAGESGSRAVIWENGFDMPELQNTVTLPNGEKARADFMWRGSGIIGEFDGRIKYGRALAPNGSAEEALVRERRREIALQRMGFTMVRWTWEDLLNPQRLVALLQSSGVPRPHVRRCL